MISRIPGQVFLVLLLVLCVPAAWLLGKYQAEKQFRVRQAQVQNVAAQETLQLQAVIAELKAESRQRKLSLEIAEARAGALQEQLDSTLKQSIDDMAELALYRRIAGADTIRGLRVDSIRHETGQQDVMAITLLQAQGRERAVGEIGLTLAGQQDGQDQRWILTDSEAGTLQTASSAMTPGLLPDEWLASPLSDEIVRVAAFDLRFFQTLLVKVNNITTLRPDYVEIWIFPEAKSLKPNVQRFRWTEINAGR